MTSFCFTVEGQRRSVIFFSVPGGQQFDQRVMSTIGNEMRSKRRGDTFTYKLFLLRTSFIRNKDKIGPKGF